MQFQEYFAGKKITVMGLGVQGRGVGDALYLAKAGAELIVTDLKTETELAESLEKLAAYSNITYRLGEHVMEDFLGRDMILVAPSVPLDSEFVAGAVKDGARKVQSAALFAELSKVPIAGVTGTRGKSTVTHMIHHVLSVVTGEPILLGGNVRGISNLQLLNEVKEDSVAVMELDSWQLQGFGWAEISPQVAVFTSFMPDHMNYYHNDIDAYFADKANIFRYQEDSGTFITTPQVFELAKKVPGVTLGQEVVLADASVIPEDAHLAMPGEHNRLNAALAYEALRAMSLTEEEIFEGLASFPGVPGRLQYVCEKDGVRIINDNNSTTPEATIAGLRAVANGQNVILIMGGAYKEIDPRPLLDAIPKHCKQVLLLAGTGTDRVKDELGGEVYDNLEVAVKAGLAVGEPGDVLLFSPGFASFGMFKNEYDRNDRFMDTVAKL